MRKLVHSHNLLTVGATVALLGHAPHASGQVCVLPDSVRALVPGTAPIGDDFGRVWQGGASLDGSLGFGHLRYAPEGTAPEGPPGQNDWLGQVELPLSDTQGAEPWGWIAGGWIVGTRGEAEALVAEALLETGYEEPSLIVLEEGRAGWLRIRYATGDRSAWTPACALQASPAGLRFIRWQDWFLDSELSPLFFRTELLRPLRSEPSPESTALVNISGDYILEPLEIRGEWMRVNLKQPSDYCAFDVEPTQTEGWVRWYSADRGPAVWFFTRGC